MCGRFTLTVSIEELMLLHSLDHPDLPRYSPRYNVAPMQMIPAIINDGNRNKLGELRWGLLPSWAKEDSFGAKMINARSETVAEKPSFRGLLTRKRCLIPSDGFYEWKRIGDKKEPYRIVLKDESLFSFAALYDTWMSPTGERISTCTIITTEPNELMQSIHNRMPVILSREDESVWLDRGIQDKDVLQHLLLPFDANKMRAYRVSAAVGNVKNNFAELIEEVV